MNIGNQEILLSEFTGEINITIDSPPVSSQARAAFKASLRDKIHAALSNVNYVFLGQVSIRIEWYINPKQKMLSDKSPDTDNIIKPIIDALCGIKGVMVDDVQLQHVQCYWIDIEKNSKEHIAINIESDVDRQRKKNSLVFFQLKNEVYLPFSLQKTSQDLMIFNHILSLGKIYVDLDEAIREDFERCTWPIGFPKFHVSRVSDSGFPCYKHEEFKSILQGSCKEGV